MPPYAIAHVDFPPSAQGGFPSAVGPDGASDLRPIGKLITIGKNTECQSV